MFRNTNYDITIRNFVRLFSCFFLSKIELAPVHRVLPTYLTYWNNLLRYNPCVINIPFNFSFVLKAIITRGKLVKRFLLHKILERETTHWPNSSFNIFKRLKRVLNKCYDILKIKYFKYGLDYSFKIWTNTFCFQSKKKKLIINK